MTTKSLILSLILLLAITLTPRRSSAGFFRDPRSIPTALNATSGAWESFNNFSGSHAGQHVDGLSKIKSYFHEFGYLPLPATGNFSDDYDEPLVAAVRLYQQNFRLNVSGELDDDTLRKIVVPRCGVADIINGINSMASKTTPSPSFGVVAHYSFFEGEPRWPANKKTLTYAFLPSNQLPETVKKVFACAFARWANVIPLNFSETTNYTAADIKIGFYGGDHSDGSPFTGPLMTLAHSFSPTDGRFHLDDAETWVYQGDVTKSSVDTAVDLQSVVVHEIGHLLGLAHSADEAAVMFPSIDTRTRKVKLANDDVEGIQGLYGSNPNYGASEGNFDGVCGAGVRLSLRWPGSLWGFAAALWFLVFWLEFGH